MSNHNTEYLIRTDKKLINNFDNIDYKSIILPSLVFRVKGFPESHFFSELLGIVILILSLFGLFFRFYLVGYR